MQTLLDPNVVDGDMRFQKRKPAAGEVCTRIAIQKNVTLINSVCWSSPSFCSNTVKWKKNPLLIQNVGSLSAEQIFIAFRDVGSSGHNDRPLISVTPTRITQQ
jgi:hypothetical protein